MERAEHARKFRFKGPKPEEYLLFARPSLASGSRGAALLSVRPASPSRVRPFPYSSWVLLAGVLCRGLTCIRLGPAPGLHQVRQRDRAVRLARVSPLLISSPCYPSAARRRYSFCWSRTRTLKKVPMLGTGETVKTKVSEPDATVRSARPGTGCHEPPLWRSVLLSIP